MLIEFRSEAYRVPSRPVDKEAYDALVEASESAQVSYESARQARLHHRTVAALLTKRTEAQLAVRDAPRVWQWRRTREWLRRHVADYMLATADRLTAPASRRRFPADAAEDILVADGIVRLRDAVFTEIEHAEDAAISCDGVMGEVGHLAVLMRRAVGFATNGCSSSITGSSQARAALELSAELHAVLHHMTMDCLRHIVVGTVVEE